MCSSLRILESWDKLEIHFPHSTEQLTEGMEKNFKVHAWKSLMPFVPIAGDETQVLIGPSTLR